MSGTPESQMSEGVQNANLTTGIDLKKCNKCQTERLVSEFHKDKSKEDGLRTICKECTKIYHKDYEIQNKEYRKNYSIVNKSRKALNNKIWRLANEGYNQNYYRAYRAANRERLKELSRKYYKTLAGKNSRMRNNHKRRALKRSALVENFSPLDVFLRDKYRCQICGVKTRPDYKNPYHPKYPNLDHIIPLSKGGEHSMKNTQCLCFQCNTTKQNKENFGDQLRMF